MWKRLSEIGFLDDDEAKRARLEFARILECEWARDPAYALPKSEPLTDKETAELNGLTSLDDQFIENNTGKALKFYHWTELNTDLNAVDEEDETS